MLSVKPFLRWAKY